MFSRIKYERGHCTAVKFENPTQDTAFGSASDRKENKRCCLNLVAFSSPRLPQVTTRSSVICWIVSDGIRPRASDS